jgi:NADH-quinone oxidoreductase subunit L
LPERIRQRFGVIYTVLVRKYFADDLAEKIIPGGSLVIGNLLWKVGDEILIDGALVNGSARIVGWASGVIRGIQTGRLYTYAFVMIIGLAVMLAWLLMRSTGY